MALLEVEGIETAYGMSQALFGISLWVEPGQIVSLLGRNGVGKTTAMRSVIGLNPPHRGVVRWKGEEIQGLPTHRISRKGIGFVPEDRRIFPDLTVWENLDIARRPGPGGKNVFTEARIYEFFPKLKELRDRRGGHLSGGEQQMLTISRTLLTNPELLLLDEPSEGLAPLIVEALRDQIDALRKEGLAILLAEQNLDFVLSLSDRVYILEKGEVKFEGSTADVRANEVMLQRYLTV